jgi:predicted transglutaminase-like cysteine proteinase
MVRPRHIILGIAAALLPGVAAAQDCPGTASTAPTPAISKAAAILGGAPSALEAIRMQQAGAAPSPRVVMSMAAPVAVTGIAADVRPSCPSFVWPAAPVGNEASTRGEAIVDGRPDVFGSLAIKVAHTRFDPQWTRAGLQGGLPARGPWVALIERTRTNDPADKLEAVNHWVNRIIRFRSDAATGRRDIWPTAAQTLRGAAGDCEDYAIAKLQLLAALGIAREDMYLIVVRDLVRRADHAVLGVNLGGRMLILDNETDRILPSAAVADYRPILTFGARGAWVHGYRAAPVTLASAE